MYVMTHDSLIGRLLLEADDQGITAIRVISSQEAQMLEKPSPLLERAVFELSEYFDGKRQTFDFPVSMHGTEFECAVWQILGKIPFGELRTYGQIAAELGMKSGARAVGRACSHNPVLIAVPCHRVIASDGALTGFAGGMDAKRILLQREGHDVRADRIR